jgi:hypothetical protein
MMTEFGKPALVYGWEVDEALLQAWLLENKVGSCKTSTPTEDGKRMKSESQCMCGLECWTGLKEHVPEGVKIIDSLTEYEEGRYFVSLFSTQKDFEMEDIKPVSEEAKQAAIELVKKIRGCDLIQKPTCFVVCTDPTHYEIDETDD